MPEVLSNSVNVAERRIFERIEAKYPLRLNLEESPFSSEMYLRDFSASGMKIISNQRLDVNKDFDFWVDVPDGHEPIHFCGRVVWLKNVGKYVWDAGIRFKHVRFMDCCRMLNCSSAV